ncbi:MAG: lipopolysaccharide core heptose(I) kinase RfaP [Thiohalomonas sp.]|nr:lipopolysaccharide core heptose(I) kinase RfaP [Thiohalomonas sp.]
MQLELSTEFAQQWQNKDPFTEAENLQGEVFRALEARKTLRFLLSDKGHEKSYFIKIHRGVGWFEIIENLIRLRLPVLGAKNEYLAIKKLEALHIDTMHIAGYALKGKNPAQQQSFIITEYLINTISLEDFCADWPQTPPKFRLKQSLISKLAHISSTMHENGINHRDFYICHFLLNKSLLDKDFMEKSQDKEQLDHESLKVSLIDLHRAQIRQHTPERWIVKDIASLYFSAMNIGMTQRDFYRFMKGYHHCSLRDCLTQHGDFWQKVELQGQKLWRRKQRKGDAI